LKMKNKKAKRPLIALAKRIHEYGFTASLGRIEGPCCFIGHGRQVRNKRLAHCAAGNHQEHDIWCLENPSWVFESPLTTILRDGPQPTEAIGPLGVYEEINLRRVRKEQAIMLCLFADVAENDL